MLEPRLNPNLNKHDKVYHQLSYDILTSPELNFRDAQRTVVDTIGVFGPQTKMDLTDNSIPLSQTKPIGYKTQLFPEIVGFLKGENNLKWYLEQGMKIWTANAFNFYRSRHLDINHPWYKLKKDSPDFEEALKEYEQLVLSGNNPKVGDLGEFYPRQWRNFRSTKKLSTGHEVVVEVDQIETLIKKLKEEPTGRYAVVTAWNPVDVKFNQAALAPCHNTFQAYRYTDRDGVDRVSVKMYQRSADHLLGVAFNKPQYAALTSIIAKEVGAEPGKFIHTFGDLHIYVGQGDRAQWYKDTSNLNWLQNEIISKKPNEVLENLLDRLPKEENPGYDHIPYLLQQLGRESVGDVPKLEISEGKTIDSLEVSDLKVLGYDVKDRAPPLVIDDVKPKMAS